MEEIITWIEETWSRWAQQSDIQVQWINVDEMSFKDIAKYCLHSDKILVTCFNLKIASVLTGLRSRLGIQTPWIFYLHGLASFACWPLYRWQVGELLTMNDSFVVSCERDLAQVRLVFPDIKTFVIPFSLPLPQKIIPKKKGSKKKFAFIGRISSQKNLHNLIVASSLLENDFELHFFGKEDLYGSPLMGFKDEGYLKTLQELTNHFKLEDKIFFHGFMNRLSIERIMNDEEWIFIAPSIHSDENFGMAAFRCLLNGHQCILSDWGGHADYPKNFPHQVKLLKVYHSEIGPWISINELKDAMDAPSKTFQDFSTPSYYQDIEIFKSIASAFFYSGSSDEVKTTKVLRIILERRENYIQMNSSEGGSRIYENYKDPLKDQFFNAYAGGNFKKIESENNQLVPWVSVNNGAVNIFDSHRGVFQFSEYEVNLNACGLSYKLNS